MALDNADQDERRQWAGLTWELICTMIDVRLLDAALTLHGRQVRLAGRHPGDGELQAQVGKSATELHQYLSRAGRGAEAHAVVKDSEAALRSPDYRAARQADLGEDPQTFLTALDRLLRRRRLRFRW